MPCRARQLLTLNTALAALLAALALGQRAYAESSPLSHSIVTIYAYPKSGSSQGTGFVISDEYSSRHFIFCTPTTLERRSPAGRRSQAHLGRRIISFVSRRTQNLYPNLMPIVRGRLM
jgi:hypothetical protein